EPASRLRQRFLNLATGTGGPAGFEGFTPRPNSQRDTAPGHRWAAATIDSPGVGVNSGDDMEAGSPRPDARSGVPSTIPGSRRRRSQYRSGVVEREAGAGGGPRAFKHYK